MRIIPNYNHYDLNPPEPIIEPQNPIEFEQEMIEEHDFEKNYEDTSIRSYDLIERKIFNELIKNEPKQCNI